MAQQMEASSVDGKQLSSVTTIVELATAVIDMVGGACRWMMTLSLERLVSTEGEPERTQSGNWNGNGNGSWNWNVNVNVNWNWNWNWNGVGVGILIWNGNWSGVERRSW
jgi:hypothetical protein